MSSIGDLARGDLVQDRKAACVVLADHHCVLALIGEGNHHIFDLTESAWIVL